MQPVAHAESRSGRHYFRIASADEVGRPGRGEPHLARLHLRDVLLGPDALVAVAEPNSSLAARVEAQPPLRQDRPGAPPYAVAPVRRLIGPDHAGEAKVIRVSVRHRPSRLCPLPPRKAREVDTKRDVVEVDASHLSKGRRVVVDGKGSRDAVLANPRHLVGKARVLLVQYDHEGHSPAEARATRCGLELAGGFQADAMARSTRALELVQAREGS
mmetsp:Transcript_10646/g.33869  ORF Transcript_10646/g.33869 Transcript_10646/m.33869 type:complete len:215 (+) Transcript_10646:1634-2278(+)